VAPPLREWTSPWYFLNFDCFRGCGQSREKFKEPRMPRVGALKNETWVEPV